MKAGRIVFSGKKQPAPTGAYPARQITGDNYQDFVRPGVMDLEVYFLVDGSPLNGRVSPPPSVRCSSFMGIWPMALSTNFFLARVLRRAYGRVFCFFSSPFSFFLPATGHFLGSGRTSFRFSVHCVPVLPASLRPLAENAPTLHSRERVQAQDRIIPTCSRRAHRRRVRERYFRGGTHAATRFV